MSILGQLSRQNFTEDLKEKENYKQVTAWSSANRTCYPSSSPADAVEEAVGRPHELEELNRAHAFKEVAVDSHPKEWDKAIGVPPSTGMHPQALQPLACRSPSTTTIIERTKSRVNHQLPAKPTSFSAALTQEAGDSATCRR